MRQRVSSSSDQQPWHLQSEQDLTSSMENSKGEIHDREVTPDLDSKCGFQHTETLLAGPSTMGLDRGSPRETE